LELADDESVQSLTHFTLQIFRDIFSKEYEATAADLPYFLAPTLQGHGNNFAGDDLASIIDWKTLDFVKATEKIQCDPEAPDEFFKEKYITDPFDGAQKFYMRQRRHNLKPTDPVPKGIVPPHHKSWKTCENKNILNYSNSLWSKSRSRWTLKEDQPVVEAEVLPIRRNLLDDDIQDEDLQPKKCFLVLETLRISPVSTFFPCAKLLFGG
jgi:endoribonuclease Dicer